MIVADASAAVAALLRDGAARSRLSVDAVQVPHLADTEVVDALRKLLLRGLLDAAVATQALLVWRRLGVQRYASHGLLDRVWELRHNVSAYDATYVALAEALGCSLLTADARLAGASGVRCTIELVPR